MTFWNFINSTFIQPLQLENSFKATIWNPIKNAPQNFKNNATTIYQSGMADFRRDWNPTTTDADKLMPVGFSSNGSQAFMATEDVTITNSTFGTSHTITKGSVIMRADADANRTEAGGFWAQVGLYTGVFDTNSVDRYDLFSAARDRNGDGYIGDGLFTDEHGRVWTEIKPNHPLMESLRNSAPGDQQTSHLLPQGMNYVGSNDFVYTVSNTGYGTPGQDVRWMKVTKDFVNFDNNHSYGRNPYTGQNQFSQPYFAGQGYWQNGHFGQPYQPNFGWNQGQGYNPYGYNPNNPFEYQYTTNNVDDTYFTTPTITYLEAVHNSEISANPDLATLKQWLQAGNTYQGGSEAGGNYTPPTLSGYGAWGVQHDGKNLLAAYVNSQGDLIVEYA